MSFVTRRQLVGAAVAGAAAHVSARVGAIGPVKRSGSSRIKLGLCAYSYRDYLTGKSEPKMTLLQFLDAAAAMPIDGVELTEYYFPKPLTSEFVAQIKRQCFVLVLAITGSPIGNNFTMPPGPKRDAEMARVRQWIDRCAEMGAPCMRIFAGGTEKGQSVDDARKNAIECIEQACDYSGKRGVMLALENHGGIVGDLDGVMAIVKAVKSEWFGLNLDTGNFRTADPYGDVAKCLPYAVTMHIKVSTTPKGMPRQDADWPRLLKMIGDAGYRGYINLEYEEPAPALDAVPKHIAKLRSLLG